MATHFLTKAGVSAIRRLRKTDNNRIARATGATIVHRFRPFCGLMMHIPELLGCPEMERGMRAHRTARKRAVDRL